MNILSAACEEKDFRAAMWVLIHATAMAVRNSTLYNEEQSHDEVENHMLNGSLLPINRILWMISLFFVNFSRAIKSPIFERWITLSIH
jgi:hypothetical protein